MLHSDVSVKTAPIYPYAQRFRRFPMAFTVLSYGHLWWELWRVVWRVLNDDCMTGRKAVVTDWPPAFATPYICPSAHRRLRLRCCHSRTAHLYYCFRNLLITCLITTLMMFHFHGPGILRELWSERIAVHIDLRCRSAFFESLITGSLAPRFPW